MDKNDLLIYSKLAKPEDNEKATSLFTESGFNVIHGFINIKKVD